MQDEAYTTDPASQARQDAAYESPAEEGVEWMTLAEAAQKYGLPEGLLQESARNGALGAKEHDGVLTTTQEAMDWYIDEGLKAPKLQEPHRTDYITSGQARVVIARQKHLGAPIPSEFKKPVGREVPFGFMDAERASDPSVQAWAAFKREGGEDTQPRSGPSIMGRPPQDEARVTRSSHRGDVSDRLARQDLKQDANTRIQNPAVRFALARAMWESSHQSTQDQIEFVVWCIDHGFDPDTGHYSQNNSKLPWAKKADLIERYGISEDLAKVGKLQGREPVQVGFNQTRKQASTSYVAIAQKLRQDAAFRIRILGEDDPELAEAVCRDLGHNLSQ